MTQDSPGQATRPAVPDQPDDWTEPGAYRVLDDVWRLPLPLPSAGLRAVNVYVARAEDGLTLVDSGWASPDTVAALDRGLAALGHTTADIRRIVVTHAHHDHYTHAIALRGNGGGPEVLLGRGEELTVDAVLADRSAAEPAMPQAAMLRRAGAPRLAEAMTEFGRAIRAADRAPWDRPDQWLDDGQAVAVGAHRVETRATPGHTRGHVVLRDEAAGALFAGDHVLPHITPSIGYERAPEPAPLRSYLASLRLVRDLPDALLLPAHGPVARSVHTRVDELLEHHEQRLSLALDLLHSGATTAHQVAAGMSWTRRERKLDDLETEHAALAVLEIAAHLDVLVDRGLARADDGTDGVRRYVPAGP
ncbi:MBL fold metallo-hydrolase [Actinomycetospora endophytica]|uniref:MBL fold metallo-hydrolase n=1 Tax=Actinomycetospora endophytica TaxID=2291215 RepID=A0ABS8P8Q0_9PSEU|nr:MBL fold metallo-hydrolase [Actinomycetospora endophytica]MCD2194633.1 MBL fold metallo-hydrolase [Actinomycetospora endophytica]